MYKACRLLLTNQVFSAIICLVLSVFGPIVYRLGHQVFILKRGVRLPLGLPKYILFFTPLTKHCGKASILLVFESRKL